MIPANGEYMATYANKDGLPARPREVVAFNDRGDAMVLGKTGLVPAQDLPGFERIVRSGTSHRVIAALPGGGWMVDTMWEDGVCTTAPVLLWAVHADGTATPIDTDFNGETSEATGNGERHYVYHPDHDEPESRKQAGFPPKPTE